MKALIYISGISGIVLIVMRIIGIYSPMFNSEIFLFTGLGLLVLVFIPLMLTEHRREDKRTEKIITNYKHKENQKKPNQEKISAGKGWGMNNSPFRERRSVLNWGAGNVHAANAKRGRRRSFLN